MDISVKQRLGDIANDALTLRQELQKSASRCHKAALSNRDEHDWRADELEEYVGIAQQLVISVAAYLPKVSVDLRILSRDSSRLASPRFTDWDTLEGEFRMIETEALRALSMSDGPPPKIVVSLVPPQVTIGGKAFALSEDQAACLKVVVEARDWVGGPKIQELTAVSRPDRQFGKIRGLLVGYDILESESGKGTRVKPEWLA